METSHNKETIRHSIQTGSGADVASYLMSTGPKEPDAAVKKVWSDTSTPQYVVARCLLTHRHKLPSPYSTSDNLL